MAKNKKMLTCDGNQAAAHVAYMFSEVAAIYPITPSSNMAEYADEWAANGRKNIFGDPVKLVEMQSEAGAAGAVHGSLQAGALTTTFTASQGLLLMIPNMYKIAGELLPGVFHVSARTLAGHALSIFGDHSDIYSTRQTGFAFLASGSVQEVMDLAAVAHLTAIKSRVPFLHFFDGFRTSHEMQKVEMMTEEDLLPLLDQKALQAFRDNALNPEHPVTRGTAQNPDVFFQAKEAQNSFFDAVPDMVNDCMVQISKITGRDYKPFTYYGAKDAENVVVAMGSITETIRETIDYLNAKGEKVGLITVHLYRPFSVKYLMNVVPASVKRICVLDRTKEIGSGDPLYLDIVEAFANADKKPQIIAGRYGLSSKDTTPAQIVSVFENLKATEPKHKFTVGIVDDVTNHSLPLLPAISVVPEGTYEAKFYGLGADGTVGANKNSITIIGENTDKYCQAYFQYDSKKSGGYTCSHLRFGDKPIRSPYLVGTPDFVGCHVTNYIYKYPMLKGLKKGGSFLLNSVWSVEETKKHLPNSMKKFLAENNISMYIINATKIADEIGLGSHTNTILQSAFFKITNVIPYEQAVKEMKRMIEETYGKKGEKVLQMNYAGVDRGADYVKIDIPAEWAQLDGKDDVAIDTKIPEFIRNVVVPINNQRGDDLPVSAFKGREDGTFPAGTSKYEKRGVAVHIPEWHAANCIQCNQCSYVCPHATIRPFLMTEAEVKGCPAGTETAKAIGKEFEGYQFRMQVSPLDCMGCGNCDDICPANVKARKDGKTDGLALTMELLETQEAEIARWNYIDENVTYKTELMDVMKNVKNSQFAQPLFEFSGACTGCGETPYIKLITQLYGERMTVANATGCSSIYGGSCPSMPYTTNHKTGHGPAWANSLFEDNAEFGFGMALASNNLRDRIERLMKEAIETCNKCSAELKGLFAEWIANKNDGQKSVEISNKIKPLIAKGDCDYCKEINKYSQYLIKKSHWIFGGDGWAYDIGFGGLDHVIASGEDVNILVMDTEVYSNTGGQASKATPVAAIAKFAAAGKRIRKKDLGVIAMSYGYVYVAQVAMGASQAQFLKVVKEAEAFPGPSVIIAYSPCIAHGLGAGMGKTQDETARAVECGYWQLWKYDPTLADQGQNPFVLESKEPDWSKFQAFIDGEVRYNSLKKTFPAEADELFKAAEDNAKWRYNQYKRLAEMKW
ncbi:MAG: pyruvate:ferredoxin (flavodoxin) oxidoreductase [Bacteroidales bacterium]|nr:pyruvate:ferredoxin (flavodoxin) oxidoreductase [Bacteroidales bacterium]